MKTIQFRNQYCRWKKEIIEDFTKNLSTQPNLSLEAIQYLMARTAEEMICTLKLQKIIDFEFDYKN